MRILFLTQPHPDYLADILYHGMTKLLGSENVFHWPPKASYLGNGRHIHDMNSQLLFDFPVCSALEKKPDWSKYDLVVGDVTWSFLTGGDSDRDLVYREANSNSCFFLLMAAIRRICFMILEIGVSVILRESISTKFTVVFRTFFRFLLDGSKSFLFLRGDLVIMQFLFSQQKLLNCAFI